ncbi:MAG TPA: VPDSG-CTERM sorting domain-containing protein [Terrimicrobiaceae bacterium]
MKKYLTSALFALALTLNVQATSVPPPPVRVPDTGSTAALFALGLAAIAFARWKTARRA